jgi:hypothetical protein
MMIRSRPAISFRPSSVWKRDSAFEKSQRRKMPVARPAFSDDAEKEFPPGVGLSWRSLQVKAVRHGEFDALAGEGRRRPRRDRLRAADEGK